MHGSKPFFLAHTLFLLLTILYSASGLAQDSTSASTPPMVVTFMANEISIGIGAAYSPEKDIFNVQDDVAAGTNPAISIAYLRNLDGQFALGVHLYGYYKSVDNVQITSNGVTKSYELIVSTLNVGAECRYTFSSGSRYTSSAQTIRPYALALLSYATGDLSNDELGSLRIGGISGGGGIGADISLGESWALALEGTATFGTAKWDEPPFLNSTSDDFNPAMYMALLRVTYLWEPGI